MTFKTYRFKLFFTWLKQKQTCLWLCLKENFTWYLISSFLLPVKSESEVYYVDLALHFLVPVPPIMCFIISIPVKWKTDVAVMEGWRQWVAAGGWNGLITSRPVCLRVEMVAASGEPWSWVQVNKQRTVGCIMISEHRGVCLLRWGFCRGGWTEEWLLLFKGDSGDVIACFSFFLFFWNALWNALRSESWTASLSWTRRERPTGFWGKPGIVSSKSVPILRKILLRNRL